MHIWNEFVKWWATPVQFDWGWVSVIALIVIGNFVRFLKSFSQRS